MSNYEDFPVQSDFRAELLAELALKEAMQTGQSKIAADGIEIEIALQEPTDGN